jgi:hypothetical protein
MVAREGHNVKASSQKIAPLAELYLSERLKHPVFAQLDALIEQMATVPAAKTTDADEFIPAGSPRVSQTPKETDADSAYYDLALNYNG